MFDIRITGTDKLNPYEELIKVFLQPSEYRLNGDEAKSGPAEDETDVPGDEPVRLEYRFDGDSDAVKRQIYRDLERHTGKSPKWGILPGIRPVKLAYELTFGDKSADDEVPAQAADPQLRTSKILKDRYLLHPMKRDLVQEILRFAKENDLYVQLYDHDVIVVEKLPGVHREIDMVTTPSGFPCAMSHANNGTSDLNAWVGIFREFCGLMGIEADMGKLFGTLYTHSLSGDPDCGGLLPYGYYSGENVTFINEGRPLFVRTPDSRFNLANFMRANLYTSLGAVKLGMDILLKDEGVKLDRIMGHGGLFKTPGVMQRYLAAAVNTPVTVMATASEGGAWGIALLAAYLADGKQDGKLEDYLDNRIFAALAGDAVAPDPKDVEGFETFTRRYLAGLPIEKAAIEAVDW